MRERKKRKTVPRFKAGSQNRQTTNVKRVGVGGAESFKIKREREKKNLKLFQ